MRIGESLILATASLLLFHNVLAGVMGFLHAEIVAGVAVGQVSHQVVNNATADLFR